jgi:hypothetical protein
MRSVNRRDLRRSRMAAVVGLADAPFSDDHEDPPRSAVSACPRGDRGSSDTRAETWGRSLLRQPSASAGRHLASTLRRAARLRSSRPQDSAPADGRVAPAPKEEMGSPSGHSFHKRPRPLHPEEHHSPTPTCATCDVRHEVNTGSRRVGSCADYRPPRKRAALRCFGAPSWRSGPSGTRATTWARSSLRRPSACACRHPASTLRLPARLRSSRPQDAVPADFVDTSAPLRRSEHEATPMPDLRCAPSVIAALVVSKSDDGTGR